MATKRDRLAECDFATFVRFYRDLDRFGLADEPPSPLPPARLEALLREHGARHGVQVIEPALTHGAQAPDERASSSPAIACHSAR